MSKIMIDKHIATSHWLYAEPETRPVNYTYYSFYENLPNFAQFACVLYRSCMRVLPPDVSLCNL